MTTETRSKSINLRNDVISERLLQAFSYEYVQKKYLLYFSTKTYVVDTQKNRLNDTVLFSTQNIC